MHIIQTFNDIANLVSPLDKTKICEVETSQVDGMPALVAQWYPNGNVVRYLDENPEVDKVDLVSLMKIASSRFVVIRPCSP